MSKYEGLNPEQLEAVKHTEGPLLILAGAGSGKTRVLTHRIAYLIEEKKVAPWKIMAITFTNKAAKEMRSRVDGLIGSGASDVWVSTFHSSCVRILRTHIDRLGYDKYFTIYDTDDSKKIIKECMKQLNVDPKQFKESAILSTISGAKNDMLSPELFAIRYRGDFRLEIIGKVYKLYQEKLKNNNALDFDDLLVKTVELFASFSDVLEKYQDKFHYIMVDEYQDTNGVQFQFIQLLSDKSKNLCVVGDDDQSIYGFRGADIQNILNFEKHYRGAKTIKLEENYRSTGNILEAANQVIQNNYGRKSKRLWTRKDTGELISFRRLPDEKLEGLYVAETIRRGHEDEGKKYLDYAILYRTNAQSRVMEEYLIKYNIPYKIIGGTSFYQRKEIKDMLAYLKIIANSVNDLAVKRVINVPRRGIGDTTVEKVENYANFKGINFFDALKEVSFVPELARAKDKITDFVTMILGFRNMVDTVPLVELAQNILTKTGYQHELQLEGTDEAKDRIENIQELFSKMADYQANTQEPSLNNFLEEVSLIADIDQLDADVDRVVLMTIHSSKGLEFPYVFLTGVEDGIFPSYMSISTSEDAIEEERRLCYVGITRAEKELYISCAISRMTHGTTQNNPVSRFIKEIPKELIELEKVISITGINAQSRESFPRSNSFITRKAVQMGNEKKPLPINKNAELDFKVGDLVKHKQFGMGQVMVIEPGGADFQVTVNFPSVGIKKLMASLSGLKK